METPLATLFRSGAVIVEAGVSLVDEQLFPEEREYIKGAVPSRRAEFGTARLCARKALAALGFGPMPLVPAENRAPRWPAGIVGSITHTHEYCAVVLDRSPPMRSIGVDAEALRQLEPATVDLIVTPAERAWVAQQDDAQDDLLVLLFSAKEAYYKCQHPLSGTFLEFQDVEVEVDRDARRFAVRALRPGLPACVRRVEGKYAFDRGRVLCGVELLD